MKKFAILGHPVAHSLSPKLHNAVFQALGLKDHSYEALDVLPEELPKVIQKMRAGEYQGFSVTIPHKQAIVPLLDELSETAKEVGAVNTVIQREDGTLFGENTDYEGFRKSLFEAGLWGNSKSKAPNPKKIPMSKFQNSKQLQTPHLRLKAALVLGSGGAAQAVIAVLKDLGFEVVVTSRKPHGQQVGYEQIEPNGPWSLIVNTTPVGMQPKIGESPLTDPSWFRSDRTYVDIIYNPKLTMFLQMAKNVGAKIITGDRMFLWQAMEQAKMFCGRDEIPLELMNMKI